MHRSHRYLTSLFLAAALAVPVITVAAPGPQEDRDANQHRVYDSAHKQYHNWDDNENHAWNRYQSEHHQKSHDFSKASKKEQTNYWNWRHTHPDKNDTDKDRRDH
jgi:hypothetical protein